MLGSRAASVKILAVLLAVLVCCAVGGSDQVEEQGLRPQSPQQQTQTQQQRWRGGGRGQQELEKGQGLVEGQHSSAARRLQGEFGELQAPGQYEPQQQHEQQQGKRSMPVTTTVSTDRTGDNQDTASLLAVGGDYEAGGAAAAEPVKTVEAVVVKGVRGASASSGEGKDVSDKEPAGTGVGVGVGAGVEGGEGTGEGGVGAEARAGDKGTDEGEEGEVVMAPRDKEPAEVEGESGDSFDNASSNGISNNIMVIVFCALAFVANGGFLVYVFWVM